MKKISIITTIVGALTSIMGVILTVMGAFPLISSIVNVFTPSSSIGIIGGADGPTAIFTTGTLFNMPKFLMVLILIAGLCIAILGAIALIVGVVLLIINKCKKNQNALTP